MILFSNTVQNLDISRYSNNDSNNVNDSTMNAILKYRNYASVFFSY